jgi:hypothetical protein
MKLLNEPVLFSPENVKKIEELKKAKYVCDTELNDIHVAIFYGDEVHPVSESRYFGLYYSTLDKQLMITNGAFIEEQDIAGVVAENGDVIYSRYRHDFRRSPDETVFVDGGRAYLRTNSVNTVSLKVKDGVLQILNE